MSVSEEDWGPPRPRGLKSRMLAADRASWLGQAVRAVAPCLAVGFLRTSQQRLGVRGPAGPLRSTAPRTRCCRHLLETGRMTDTPRSWPVVPFSVVSWT